MKVIATYTDMHEKFEVDLQNEGKKFITMLSKIGVYDVTESDAIYSNKGYVRYIEVRDKMQEGTRKDKCLIPLVVGWINRKIFIRLLHRISEVLDMA